MGKCDLQDFIIVLKLRQVKLKFNIQTMKSDLRLFEIVTSSFLCVTLILNSDVVAPKSQDDFKIKNFNLKGGTV